MWRDKVIVFWMESSTKCMYFSVLPCSSSADAQTLVNWVNEYANHPNQFMYPPSNPKAFVSTFAGESCSFGQGSVAAGWNSQFKAKLGNSFFVPSFFVDPATFGSSGLANAMDGAFQWNSAWQISQTTSTITSILSSVGSSISSLVSDTLGSTAQKTITNLLTSLTADNQYTSALAGLNGKVYMGGGTSTVYRRHCIVLTCAFV